MPAIGRKGLDNTLLASDGRPVPFFARLNALKAFVGLTLNPSGARLLFNVSEIPCYPVKRFLNCLIVLTPPGILLPK